MRFYIVRHGDPDFPRDGLTAAGLPVTIQDWSREFSLKNEESGLMAWDYDPGLFATMDRASPSSPTSSGFPPLLSGEVSTSTPAR